MTVTPEQLIQFASDAAKPAPSPETPGEALLTHLLEQERDYCGCPPWCRLEGRHHSIDLEDGRAVVDYNGPDFGEFVSALGVSFAESQEIRDVTVRVWTDLGQVEMTPETLRQLSTDVQAAAEWLESQR
jgi:hypothetical protein